MSTNFPGTTGDGAMQPDWEELVPATAAKDKKRLTTPTAVYRCFSIAQWALNQRLFFPKRDLVPSSS
jgi:hypothetical protein